MANNTPSKISDRQSVISDPQSLRVLIVEDSEDDALLTIRELKKGGYNPEYERVETAAAMRQALQDKTWDVILSDYKMPHFSGTKSISLYKKANIDIPFIIVSGAIGEETAVECMRLGAHDYIMKNNLPRLCQAIARELKEAGSRSKRKRAEEALRESEALYRKLFDNHAAVKLMIDPDTGNIIDANDAAADFYGWSREKLKRMKIQEINTLSPEEVEKEMEKARTQKRVHFEFHHRRSDGSIRDVEVFSSKIEAKGKDILHSIIHDITERKQAEEALRQSEEKYRTILENIDDGYYEVDLNGNFTFFNASMCRILGYPQEEMMGMNNRQFTDKENAKKLFKTFNEVYRTGESAKEFDWQIIRKDGTKRYIEVSVSLRKNSSGQSIGFRGIARDITERKQAEEALKESENKYRLLADNVNDVIFVLDMNLNYTYVSPSVKILRGYEPAEVMKQPYFETLTPFSLDLAVRTLSEVMELEKSEHREMHISRTLQLEMRRKDGTTVWAEVKFSFIRDENQQPVSIIGLTRDITERKQTESQREAALEALKKSEKKYRDLYDFLPIPVYEMDMETNITSANHAIYETFRGTEEDLKKGFKGWQLLSPADVEKSARNIQRLLNGEQVSGTEYNLMKLDGSVFPAIVISSVIYSDDKPVGLRGAIIDITERKQAEDKLRESEERYRALFDRSRDLVYITDFEGRFLDANDAALNRLGYTREEIGSLNFASLLDEDQLPLALKILPEIQETGIQKDLMEFRLRCKDGAYVYVETQGSAVLSNGAPVAIQAIARDITERKQAQEELQKSEERYRTILEDIDEGYFELDLAGNFTFVNDAECRDLGYWREELIGMNYRQYSDEATAKKLSELFYNVYNTGKPIKRFPGQFISKDGTRHFNDVSASLIRDGKGKPIGFRGVSQDVTERNLAEIKLRNYAEEISELYNNAPCGYHSLGADGLFTRTNDTELKWIGYERDEIVGRKKWRELLTPASRINYDKYFPIFKKQGWINDLEFDVTRKDGSIFSVLLNSMAVRDKEGNFIESRTTIFDITELKKARSKLEETNLELIKTYEELREKQVMVIQQEKMASIGVLAAGVAHEIKNPLAIMLQGVNYMQSTAGDDSIKKEVVERMYDAVLRADLIVKGLLSYARQDSLTLASQDIWPLIDSCLALTDHEFRKKNVRLIRQYTPDLPMVSVDSNQIKQVFINLIINGIHAMPRSGTFTINARQIADNEGKNFLEIIFKDTGQGIPADKINKIFDPFYTTKSGGSTGLGLSISRGIIDRHGGTIHAESQIEQGTSMIILLPLPL